MMAQGDGMDKGFEERKKKYEEKWALDEDLRFKATARRNKLFGLWAAEELGLTGHEAEAYAKAVVASALHGPDADAVFRKVNQDFEAAGKPHSEAQLHAKLAELADMARDQIMHDRG
jgi:hypothetical protein